MTARTRVRAFLAIAVVPIVLIALAAAPYLLTGARLSASVTPDAPPGLDTPAASTAAPGRTPEPAGTPARQPRPAPVTPAAAGPGTEAIVYGHSYGNRPLVAYRLGNGPDARALIGGIHGGYERNTTALARQLLAYLTAAPGVIPDAVTLYIIPVANPDGAAAPDQGWPPPVDEQGTVIVPVNRLNGRGVDLNRNWDYRWQSTGWWGTVAVSAGARPFSEPETAALRDLILARHIGTVIFYHSAYGAVFSGAGAATSGTAELARFMAEATGYPYRPDQIAGQDTTGDATDWLTVHGITSIDIELSTHEDLEWEPNLRGVLAMLRWDLAATPPPPDRGSQDPGEGAGDRD